MVVVRGFVEIIQEEKAIKLKFHGNFVAGRTDVLPGSLCL